MINSNNPVSTDEGKAAAVATPAERLKSLQQQSLPVENTTDVPAVQEETVKEAKAPLPYRHEEWRPAGDHFKSIPEEKDKREEIRQAASAIAAKMSREHAPDKKLLFESAKKLLKPLGYDDSYIGFAMVLINNEYWREEFSGIAFEKRLFSMPHCLKQAEKCTAKMDEVQLHCNGCGLCSLADFDHIGRRMGYNVLIAEGTPIVLKLIATGEVEGILGVACLNVLEKAFDKVLQIGIPAIAIPLLRDTCHNTAVDEDWVMDALGWYDSSRGRSTRSFVPLLRDVKHWFDPKPLAEIVVPERGNAPRTDKVAENERISLAWMRKGGKRFRTFVTAAAFQALTGEDEIPMPVKRVAASMELFHKASLIHDDIEDDDDFRYGTETVHKSHSVPVAINIGDYLLGRGYKEIAAEIDAIGPEKTAKILKKLSYAHVKLAEGQGAELLWRQKPDKNLQPLECLRIYALKTAPAFDVALYSGVVLGEQDGKWDDQLSEFTKHLGVAYQIQNDLKDMETDAEGKVKAFGDIQTGSPTLLYALALESATDEEKEELINAAKEGPEAETSLERIQDIYYRYEIPMQAALFADRQRERAMKAVEDIPHDGLRSLFTFLCATLLD